MSSNIEIEGTCLFCNNAFIAKTTKTKYCSLKCASKAYKQKQRKAKIENSTKGTLSKPNSTDLSILKGREYFTISKAALLLGVSRATMYRYLAANITEWYSVEDIQKKFDMTSVAVYSFVSERKIPKKKDGRTVYYSKEHIDIAKGIAEPVNIQYYTTEEAMEKYSLTRDALYHYVKYHNIPKVKEGRYIKISKVYLDELFDKPIH